jgi:hypothetical protein
VKGTGQAINFGKRQAGSYTAVATDLVTQCTQNMNGTAVIEEAPTISGQPQLCKGQTILFTADIPGGTWSSQDPATIGVDSVGNVTGLAVGSTNVVYSLPNTLFDTLLVKVNPSPTITVVQPEGQTSPVSVPSGQRAVFKADSPGGTWTQTGDPGVFTLITDDVQATVGATQKTGTITLTYTAKNGCPASITVNNVGLQEVFHPIQPDRPVNIP